MLSQLMVAMFVLLSFRGGGPLPEVQSAEKPAVAEVFLAQDPSAPAGEVVGLYSGHSDDVIGPLALAAGRYVVSANYVGDSNFVIWAHTGVEESDLLINEIGNYSGRVYLQLDSSSVVLFEVTGDGDWTLQLERLPATQDPATAPVEVAGSFSGQSDDVIGPLTMAPGLYVISTSYRGDSNFVVWAHTGSEWGDLLVNEIGDYSGEVVLQLDIQSEVVFEVIGIGDWTIEVSRVS